MKKLLAPALALLVAVMLMTSFIPLADATLKASHKNPPPHTTIALKNNTAGTIAAAVAYYDAGSTLLQSNPAHTIPTGTTVNDSGPVGTYKIVVSISSGTVKSLDFWSYDYVYNGGCVTNPNGLSSGTLYLTTSYASYVVLCGNGACL